jgi:competence protein ComEA
MNGREYLTYTKKERTGILTLLLICISVAIVPKMIFKDKPVVINIPQHDMQLLKKPEYAHQLPDTSYRQSTKRVNYDPVHPRKSKIARAHEIVEINSADTTQLISLPGIGSKLASRIILFREKLGGFYDVKQVGEVYGLRDSVFRIIQPTLRCDTSLIRKIDINHADKDALKIHPYIRWAVANTLVAYRAQHGPFHSADDLGKIDNLEEEVIQKMMPYLSFK